MAICIIFMRFCTITQMRYADLLLIAISNLQTAKRIIPFLNVYR